MKSSYFLIGSLLWGILGLGLARHAEPAQEEDLAFYRQGDPVLGREKFIRCQCTRCHRVAMDPDLPKPILQMEAPELGTLEAAQRSDQLAAAILSPLHVQQARETPYFEARQIQEMDETNGFLSEQDLIDIVTYLRAER